MVHEGIYGVGFRGLSFEVHGLGGSSVRSVSFSFAPDLGIKTPVTCRWEGSTRTR